MNISRTYLPLFRGIDMTMRRLPIMIAKGKEPGPTIWLTAAIHGDEVTGIAVIQSVFQRFEFFPLIKGTVYAIPILNPAGFETASRSEPYDEEDLNRSFGGDADGSFSERLAHKISTTILNSEPTAVIDLHTDSMNSIAYTIIDDLERPETVETCRASVELAKTLGFSWAIDTAGSAGYQLDTSISGHLVSHGIPAVTVELGGPMVVTEDFRKMGMEGVWNVLYSYGMVEASSNTYPRVRQEEEYFFYERVRTQSTGIIDYRVRPGEKIRKGKILGKIRNVFGETIEIIHAPVSCRVFSHADQSVAFPGQSLFTLAVKSRE